MPSLADFPTRIARVLAYGGTILLLGSVLILGSCSPPEWASGNRAPGQEGDVAQADRVGSRKSPAAPPWASELMGRKLNLSSTSPTECTGNLDGVRPSETGAGRVVFGWGWDVAAKVSIARIVLVDPAGVVVAAGEGGSPRGDVPRARPEINDPNTGWNVEIGDRVGPLDAYGLLSGEGRPCRLGHLAE